MKILVVCQYYYPEPFRISDICEALVSEGDEVTVLTGLPNYPEGKILSQYKWGKNRTQVINGVKVIRSFEIGRGNSKLKLFLNYFSFSISASFKALLMKEKFDAVLVNQLSPVMMGIPAIIYKKKHKKKILFYCLDLWPDSLAAGGIKKDSRIYKMFFKISKLIYSSADSILVTSSMFKDYFENILKIDSTIISHLPQYAEDIFNKNMPIYSKDEKFRFVFAGNIGDMQSVETIIKAANELRKHRNIEFHIIGDGSKLNACERLVQKLNIKNITFYGRLPIDKMPHFYSMADAMLITLKDNKSISQTLPGKIQSYMAAGKPIIGSINGETQRVIELSKSGLCCRAEDYIEFSNLILKFCISDNKEEMSLNSKKFYCDNYSKKNFIKKLKYEINKKAPNK